MILTRYDSNENGIFGTLASNDGVFVASTLEHAFEQDDGSYMPKLNAGSHECVLGTHQLDHGGPFQAYEITGIPGHKGILFHIGNTNKDSDGCVLLGADRDGNSVVHSADTFNKFMALMDGQNFTLTVS